jgi:hypothetical protein
MRNAVSQLVLLPTLGELAKQVERGQAETETEASRAAAALHEVIAVLGRHSSSIDARMILSTRRTTH